MYDRFLRQAIVLSAVLPIVVFVIAASCPVASAAFESCRDDPIVTLSNGDVIQITSTIAAYSANVQTISYILHAPPGVTAVITFPSSPLNGKETFTLVNDAPFGTYTTDTFVSSNLQASVTATSALNLLVSSSKKGYTNRHLLATLTK